MSLWIRAVGWTRTWQLRETLYSDHTEKITTSFCLFYVFVCEQVNQTFPTIIKLMFLYCTVVWQRQKSIFTFLLALFSRLLGRLPRPYATKHSILSSKEALCHYTVLVEQWWDTLHFVLAHWSYKTGNAVAHILLTCHMFVLFHRVKQSSEKDWFMPTSCPEPTNHRDVETALSERERAS